MICSQVDALHFRAVRGSWRERRRQSNFFSQALIPSWRREVRCSSQLYGFLMMAAPVSNGNLIR